MAIDPTISLGIKPVTMPSPLEAVGKAMQLRSMMDEQQVRQQQIASNQASMQERQLQTQALQDKMTHQQQVDQLMAKAMKADPVTGVTTFDRPTFEQALVQSGNGSMWPDISEHLDQMDKASQQRNTISRTAIAKAILKVKDLHYNPDAVTTQVAYLLANGYMTQDHATPILAALDADSSPEHVKVMMDGLSQTIPEYDDLTRSRQKEQVASDTATQTLRKTKIEADNLEKYGSNTPPSLEKQSVMLNGRPAFASYNPKSGKWTDASGQDVTDKVTPIPPSSTIINNAQGVQADADSLAQSLVEGTLVPSQMSKFGGAFNKAIAAANRLSQEKTGKLYNAAKANIEYSAANRFVGSLNGQQMIRFKGLAGSVVNTIDEVNRLSDELDQSGVTFLNAAELQAKVKMLGNTPAGQAAAQYLGAVYTLKEEFANLVNGGYAPTDAAFQLANKQINENAGKQAMHSSLNEVKRLINYRLLAFDQLKPMGVDQNNPAIAGIGGGTVTPTPATVKKNDPLGIR